MKPSEMSNEELADAIEFEVAERPIAIAHLVSDDYYLEAAARLRNSIPKPVVEVSGLNDEGFYSLWLNKRRLGVYVDKAQVESDAGKLRTALGINDTEGGE